MTAAAADKALVGVEKKGRRFLASTLREALVTAVEERGGDLGRLVVHGCYVTKGRVTKRIRPWHGKGRFGVEHKRHSRLVLTLRQVDDEEWEMAYMPGYVHRRFRPVGGGGGGGGGGTEAAAEAGGGLLPGTPLPWEVRSQMDVALYETYRRTAVLRERLAARQKAGGGARRNSLRLLVGCVASTTPLSPRAA
ncbi:hypothetical protein BU14_0215s0007 [Porphyra umbilicalis]|uniref:Uncharacterized protein n=1 Tax=Porphyra umbilicalis TaxID=2786 RepID=A0A1X6P5B6_PORUM|nr:hypothetical protein BU14_0215s0007 [Porphyra umbilicalis]|eukprot:OSX75945.1 hypothetical protein BU14_0215s0007 [Porphyra umbilicalis]